MVCTLYKIRPAISVCLCIHAGQDTGHITTQNSRGRVCRLWDMQRCAIKKINPIVIVCVIVLLKKLYIHGNVYFGYK